MEEISQGTALLLLVLALRWSSERRIRGARDLIFSVDSASISRTASAVHRRTLHYFVSIVSGQCEGNSTFFQSYLSFEEEGRTFLSRLDQVG